MKQVRRSLALLVAAAFLLLAAEFDGVSATQRKVRPRRPRAVKLIRLPEVEPLKAAFQRDAGNVRVVTILSPT